MVVVVGMLMAIVLVVGEEGNKYIRGIERPIHMSHTYGPHSPTITQPSSRRKSRMNRNL